MALDLTTFPAQVAIVPGGQEPTPTDWVAAEWVTTAPTDPIKTNNRLTTDYWFAKVTATIINEAGAVETATGYLRVLVGPTGTVTLPAAPVKAADFWSSITANPEVPVQKHATIPIS